MNVLLDTQALLWFLLDDYRLSRNAREKIVSTSALVFVSSASLWDKTKREREQHSKHEYPGI
mgnify:CR=1 FL=1